MQIKLQNSLTRAKEVFQPIDENHVGMYVCGPTVYARPHIGNARSVVIFDLLYRLLREVYPKVTYVRNITDVDDKINKAAKEDGISIGQLTKRTTQEFHEDTDALNVLRPDIEPKATEHISNIISMIEKLIENEAAYVSEGHVLFSVDSFDEYGKLSGKKLEDLIAGARVDVESYKKAAGDFVLWKPANDGDDESSVFESPWGLGRPGWHIECSAMTHAHLGENFDIHGGGADLKFPHHDNEIAQSRCAHHGSDYAKYWVHNGFLTVNGEKMSKSLGNFITMHDLLEKGIHGQVIRIALLSANYNKPLDWNDKLLADSKKTAQNINKIIEFFDESGTAEPENFDNLFLKTLSDDLNTSNFFAAIHKKISEFKKARGEEKTQLAYEIKKNWQLAGFKYFKEESAAYIDELYIL